MKIDREEGICFYISFVYVHLTFSNQNGISVVSKQECGQK